MKRTQVLLTEEQQREIKQIARAESISAGAVSPLGSGLMSFAGESRHPPAIKQKSAIAEVVGAVARGRSRGPLSAPKPSWRISMSDAFYPAEAATADL